MTPGELIMRPRCFENDSWKSVIANSDLESEVDTTCYLNSIHSLQRHVCRLAITCSPLVVNLLTAEEKSCKQEREWPIFSSKNLSKISFPLDPTTFLCSQIKIILSLLGNFLDTWTKQHNFRCLFRTSRPEFSSNGIFFPGRPAEFEEAFHFMVGSCCSCQPLDDASSTLYCWFISNHQI